MTIEIICADVLTYPLCATAYDVMIVDPPYSEHVHKKAVSHSAGRGYRSRDLGFDCLSSELQTKIKKFTRQVNRWSVVYSDLEGFGGWCNNLNERESNYIRGLPWVRWSQPQMSGDRPPQGSEMIAIFWGSQRGKKSWNGPGNLTHLAHKCLRGEGKHKSEKPLDQALDLVTWFSNPGERILDPCAGSGTIGLACKILGREYSGYEIDPGWAEKAANRISAATLSERDQERYERWVESQKAATLDAERREKNTEKARVKNKLASVPNHT